MSRWSLGIALGVMGMSGVTGVAIAGQPSPSFPPIPTAVPGQGAVPGVAKSPEKSPGAALEAEGLSLLVRGADLGDVIRNLREASETPLEVDPVLLDKRLTLIAEGVSGPAVLQALAEHAESRWRTVGSGRRLEPTTEAESAWEQRRIRRNSDLIWQFMTLADQVSERGSEYMAARIRYDLSRRDPAYPVDALNQITPTFLSQLRLLEALSYPAVAQRLAETGSAWVPLSALPPRSRDLLAAYYLQAVVPAPTTRTVRVTSAETDESRRAVALLRSPRARVEYRLLYGDRWTGTILVVRVGASDQWATTLLPSVLTSIPPLWSPPAASLNPAPDPELVRSVNLRLDTDSLNWEQAITQVARTAGVNVITDSYLRPAIYRPAGLNSVIWGSTLRHTLDRLSERYGMVWWKSGDFFHFRSRNNPEEERAAVPQTVLTHLGKVLATDSRLSGSALFTLSGLSDEQLTSLHLAGAARDRPVAGAEALDLNQLQLNRVALRLLAAATPEQREQARTTGLAVELLPDTALQSFAAAARDRGIELDDRQRDQWRLRWVDQFARHKLPNGWAEFGEIRFTLQFSATERRSSVLMARFPAAARLNERSPGDASPRPPTN